MNSAHFTGPPNCGYRLIPELVDDIAHTDPQRTFVAIPKSSRVEDGFVDISYQQFSKAINRLAWWMDNKLGRSRTSKTLVHFGPLDFRYFIVIIAAAKTGHVASALFIRFSALDANGKLI